MIELRIDHQPRSIGSLEPFPEKWSSLSVRKCDHSKERECFPIQSNWKSALAVGPQSMNLATEPAS
jgi:hypothetical protein